MSPNFLAEHAWPVRTVLSATLFLALLVPAGRALAQELRPGDELLIAIPEVGGQVERVAPVGADGTVSLGVYGSVPVSGLTIAEAERAVREHLSRYLRNTGGVSVSLERTQRVVLVTGQVTSPGLTTLRGAADPWLAVQAAGGAAPGADLSRVVVYRGSEEIPVDLRAYLTRDRREPLPELLQGDTVFVPADPGMPLVQGAAAPFLGEEALRTKVFILGAVANPGVYDRTPVLNPLTALALAGGPAAGADLSNVRLITMESSERVDLEAWMLGRGAGPSTIPSDGGAIMYVPTRSTGAVTDPFTDRVYLMGAINTNGPLEVSGPIMLVELLGLAGGYSAGADLEDVHVIRQGERYSLASRYDLETYLEEGGGAGSVVVYPGDIVVIGALAVTPWEEVVSVVSDLVLLSTSVLVWINFSERN